MADISNAYWSETDASNSSAAPNGWPAGTMLPSDVEPTGQMMMGATKRFWDRLNAQVTTTGAAGSYVYLPTNVAYPTAIVQGEVFGFVAHQNSAGNDTFTINGTTVLGPYNIYVATQAGGIRQIKAGEIVQNQICAVQYSSAAGGMVLQAVAQPYGDGQKYVVAGGSADAWTAAVSVTALFDGMELLVKFPQANATTTPTINVNGLGAKVIGGDAGAPLNAGDIGAGTVRAITYDASLGKFVVFLGNSVGSAQVSAAAAAADAAAAHADRLQTDSDVTTTGTNATNAANSATTASSSATTAQNAANAALANGHIYASTTAAQGDAGLANGSYYAVPQNSPANTYYDLYLKNSSSSSTYINSFPSTALVGTINAGVTAVLNTYGVTTNTANFAAGATYYGVRAPGPGVIKNLNVNVSASGTGAYLVARRVALGTLNTHQVESITTGISVPASGVNTIPVSITVNKGDLVMFAMTSGGGLCYTAGGSLGGVPLAAPSVGTTFNAPNTTTTNQPSISYDLVQNTRLNSNDTTIKTLKSGTGESFAPTTQTFGDVSVGTGSPTTGAASRGTSALSPAGLLTQVRWRTPSASKMVDANIIVWGPPSDASLNYTALSVLPVSVLTDSGGLATATADDLGPVLVPEGCYIHVLGFDPTYSGVLRYSPDSRGATAAIGGTTVSVGTVCEIDPFSNTAAYAVDYTITQSDALALSSRVDANDRFKSAVSSALGTENLKVGYISGQYDATTNGSLGGYTIPRDGTITSLSVDVTAAGTGVFLYLKKANSNRYRVASQTAYNAAGAGLTTVSASIAAQAGDLIAVMSKTGGFLRHNANTGTGIGFSFDSSASSPLSVGSLCRVSSPFNPALQYTLSTPRTEQVDSRAKGGLLLYQPFTANTRPSDWTDAGGTWTYGNGATPPASPGYATRATWSLGSSIGRREIVLRMTVNDAAGSAGIVFVSGAGGSIACIDGTAGQLQIRTLDAGNGSTLVKSVALPAALVAGRDYLISVKKDGLTWTATMYDTITQQTCSVSATVANSYTPFNGYVGCVYISGSTAPKFQWVSMETPHKRWDVRTLILGDSNAEGSNYAALAGNPSWATQLQSDSTAGEVMLAVQSGDSADITYRIFNDVQRHNPRHVVIALGTNDVGTSLNTWRGRLSYTIETAEAICDRVTLCTIPPRSGYEALCAQMSADIRAGYFGAYSYIDFSKALSTGHDGSTQNASLFAADGTHMNTAGQAVALAQVRADAPHLFW